MKIILKDFKTKKAITEEFVIEGNWNLNDGQVLNFFSLRPASDSKCQFLIKHVQYEVHEHGPINGGAFIGRIICYGSLRIGEPTIPVSCMKNLGGMG